MTTQGAPHDDGPNQHRALGCALSGRLGKAEFRVLAAMFRKSTVVYAGANGKLTHILKPCAGWRWRATSKMHRVVFTPGLGRRLSTRAHTPVS